MQNTGAVILAAGGSLRLGRPKQLMQFRGKTLVRRIVDFAREAGCDPVAVVVGSGKEKIVAELRDSGAMIVENEHWRTGIGSSIRAGVQHLIDNEPLAAIVLLVCDQPFVDAELIKQLLAHRAMSRKAIAASRYGDTVGVPALFDRSCFSELLAIDDEAGAKKIILQNRERMTEFAFPPGKIDIDTRSDYERLTNEM